MVRSFRQGEPSATSAVRRRVRRILSFRGLGIPAEERRDLEQEVVVQLWQAAGREEYDLTSGFWGLVEVVTARRIVDWRRARREGDELDPAERDRGSGPLGLTLDRERRRLVASALSRLEPSCRELIALRVFEHRPYAEIAQIVGKSEGALRVQLHRCIGRARRILERLAASPPGGAGAAGGG